MTITLSQLQTNCQSLLDEVGGPFAFSAAELTVWINDGLRHVARVSTSIQSINTTLAIISGVGAYTMPSDTIQLHRVEFIPTGSTQLYPVEIRERDEIDGRIGFNQQIQSSYPDVCWLWGTPGNATFPLQINFFPIFSTAGTVNLWYFRMPTALVNGTDVAEIPNGWEDLIPLFVISRAKMKTRDPTWRDAQSEFQSLLNSLVDMTRHWHDQPTSMIGNRNQWSMNWLYNFED